MNAAQVWAACAAAVYLAGLVVLFGVRSRRHRRVTGTSGYAGFEARDRWARAGGSLFASAMVLGALAPLLATAGVLTTLPLGRFTSLMGVLGLIVTSAGLAMAWFSQSAMGSSWRIGVDVSASTTLVTTGIFSYARNPIFTAMIVAQAGTVAMAPTWLSVVAGLVLVGACQLQVRRVEEPYLIAACGAAYFEYAARTGRFLPVLGRLRSPEPPVTAADPPLTRDPGVGRSMGGR